MHFGLLVRFVRSTCTSFSFTTTVLLHTLHLPALPPSSATHACLYQFCGISCPSPFCAILCSIILLQCIVRCALTCHTYHHHMIYLHVCGSFRFRITLLVGSPPDCPHACNIAFGLLLWRCALYAQFIHTAFAFYGSGQLVLIDYLIVDMCDRTLPVRCARTTTLLSGSSPFPHPFALPLPFGLHFTRVPPYHCLCAFWFAYCRRCCGFNTFLFCYHLPPRFITLYPRLPRIALPSRLP